MEGFQRRCYERIAISVVKKRSIQRIVELMVLTTVMEKPSVAGVAGVEAQEVEIGNKEHEGFIVRQNTDCSVDHKAHCLVGLRIAESWPKRDLGPVLFKDNGCRVVCVCAVLCARGVYVSCRVVVARLGSQACISITMRKTLYVAT